MSNTHNGSCLCGAVTYEVEGAFDRFFLCHCSYCRKDTGSAHAANLFSKSAKLTWLTGEDQITSFTVPGTRHSKTFCKTCGSATPRTQFGGRLVVVPAGSLDSDLSQRPNAHIMMGSKAAWDDCLHEAETMDGLPG